MYQLAITQPGTLAPGVHKEITPNQVSIITAILRDSTITYGEVLAFLAGRRIGRIVIDYDAPVGAGESVEASRG